MSYSGNLESNVLYVTIDNVRVSVVLSDSEMKLFSHCGNVLVPDSLAGRLTAELEREKARIRAIQAQVDPFSTDPK